MKKLMSIDEMNAIKTKYDHKLSRKDIFKMAILPAIYLPTILFLTFFYWWLIPIGIIGGFVYAITVMIPKQIQSSYERQSFRERNRFINNFSQSVHRKNATILDALTEVSSHRLKGELQTDIKQLAAKIDGLEPAGRKDAYNDLINKYSKDRIFVQFVEHMITLDINGKMYLEALDETAEAHDHSLEWQEHLMEEKKAKLIYYLVNSALAFLLAEAAILLTWETYLRSFAHSVVGWIFGIAYLGMTFYFNHRFVLDYNDEEIMEVRF